MKNWKWILGTIVLMVLAYAVLHAVISFIWMVYIGVIAGCIVLGAIAIIKLAKWLNGSDQEEQLP